MNMPCPPATDMAAGIWGRGATLASSSSRSATGGSSRPRGLCWAVRLRWVMVASTKAAMRPRSGEWSSSSPSR